MGTANTYCALETSMSALGSFLELCDENVLYVFENIVIEDEILVHFYNP